MDILTLLDKIQSIARNGLNFPSTEYDRDRYERLLNLTTKTYSELLGIPNKKIRSRFLDELGYITPKVGADAAIFNEHGEILLMDRIDDTGWCLPCGWVETNEKPVDAVKREVFEETGLTISVKQLVGVFTRLPSIENGPHTMIAVLHLCEVISGELTVSHEGKALHYWQINKVKNWHANHLKYANAAYKMWKSEKLLPAISD